MKGENVNLLGFPKKLPIIASSISDIKNTLNLLSKNSGHTAKKLEEYAKSLGVGSIGYKKSP